MYLFLDVDGTIINYKGETPQSARYALQQAQKNGHQLIVCTGCSECEVEGRNIGIDFDGFVGGNGCYVRLHDKVVYHKPLSLEQCTHFVDWCKSRGLGFRLECNSGMYISDDYEEKSLPARMKYVHGNGSGEVKAPKLASWMVKGEDLYRTDVNKTAFVLTSYQDYLDAKEEFPDLIVDTWGGKDELALYGAVRCEADKKTSIELLMEKCNIKKEEMIGFGDGVVDIPMFETCGESVAMGNGTDVVKNAATYVTSDVDEDGLYLAFKHFHLIGE